MVKALVTPAIIWCHLWVPTVVMAYQRMLCGVGVNNGTKLINDIHQGFSTLRPYRFVCVLWSRYKVSL